MKRIFIAILAVVIFSTAASAKKEPAAKKLDGYLVDKMCSKRMIGHMDKAMKHTKTCLIEESCASTGYGLLTEKKYILFDAKGNELVANYLKTTSKESNFMVEVTGSMKKNRLAISSITDVPPQK